MLLVGQVERQYLADRTGLVTAAHMSGEEVTPPTLDEALADFESALREVPIPQTDRERRNAAILRAVNG